MEELLSLFPPRNPHAGVLLCRLMEMCNAIAVSQPDYRHRRIDEFRNLATESHPPDDGTNREYLTPTPASSCRRRQKQKSPYEMLMEELVACLHAMEHPDDLMEMRQCLHRLLDGRVRQQTPDEPVKVVRQTMDGETISPMTNPSSGVYVPTMVVVVPANQPPQGDEPQDEEPPQQQVVTTPPECRPTTRRIPEAAWFALEQATTSSDDVSYPWQTTGKSATFESVTSDPAGGGEKMEYQPLPVQDHFPIDPQIDVAPGSSRVSWSDPKFYPPFSVDSGKTCPSDHEDEWTG